MQQHFLLFIVFFILFNFLNSCRAYECLSNHKHQNKVAYTITVSKSGNIGTYSKIQDAIDSIPSGNLRWIRIFISSGEYSEKVIIPNDKGCIALTGSAHGKTKIKWGDHSSTATSPTFTSMADNIIIKHITFENTFRPLKSINPKLAPALAVEIYGDKVAFYSCSFIGVQDTVGDMTGRHLFQNCHIEGAVDFIFGFGQSIYQDTDIKVTMGNYDPLNRPGFITADGRNSPDSSGFIFNRCKIYGNGKAYLGRAWKPYSRVIFYDTEMSDVIVPEGWDSWRVKSTNTIEYVEYGCKGAGANTAKRVKWMKKIPSVELLKFLNLSYINQEGWLQKMPGSTLRI